MEREYGNNKKKVKEFEQFKADRRKSAMNREVFIQHKIDHSVFKMFIKMKFSRHFFNLMLFEMIDGRKYSRKRGCDVTRNSR